MATEDTVSEIITDSRDYASDTYELAVEIVGQAMSAAAGFSTPTAVPFAFNADSIQEPVFPIAPDGFSDNFNVVATIDPMSGLNEIYVPQIPDFPDAPDPLDTSDLFNFDRPVYDVAPFSESPPIIDTDITVPDAPTINAIDAPTITVPTIPDAPDITIPTFDEEFDGIDPPAIEDLAQRYIDEHDSILPVFKDFVESNINGWVNDYAPEYHNALAKLEAKIDNDMDGGTAMSDAIESAILNRAKSRSENERTRVDKEVLMQASKRGFSILPGTTLSGLKHNQQSTAENVSKAAIETAIERARLEQQHIQFVMEMSNQIRNYMVSAFLQYASVLLNTNQQAMTYAKDIVASLVEEYNAVLKVYDLKMRLYEVLARVYEVRVRSALAELEEYKISVEAAKLEMEVEKLEVDVYAQQIAAQRSLVEMYATQLKAVITEAELEKLKVEIFSEQVNSFLAQVKAKVAEFDVYKAAISGDEARVRAFGEVVGAYKAEVAAAGVKVDAEKAISQVDIAANNNIIDQYKAELAGFISEVDAEGKRYDSSTRAYIAGLDGYKTELETQLQTFRIKYEKAKLDLDAAITEYQGETGRRIKVSELFQSHIKLQADTALGASNVAASVASAALNATNSMVSIAAEATD
jgi:hypothetical protein